MMLKIEGYFGGGAASIVERRARDGNEEVEPEELRRFCALGKHCSL